MDYQTMTKEKEQNNSWEEEIQEILVAHDKKTAGGWGNDCFWNDNCIYSKRLLKLISHQKQLSYYEGFDAGGQTKGGTGRIMYQRGFEKGQADYKQFILNILDGIDEADRQMGNKGGGTKAIRLALNSRMI